MLRISRLFERKARLLDELRPLGEPSAIVAKMQEIQTVAEEIAAEIAADLERTRCRLTAKRDELNQRN